MTTRPVPFPSFAADTLERLAQIVKRAARGRAVDALLLETELLNTLHVTGTAHGGSEEAVAWHEETAAGPDHRELARLCGYMAEAADPLDPSVCTREIWPELNGLVINRWTVRWRRDGRGQASLRRVVWAELSAAEREEVRAMARHLKLCHLSRVRAHRPRKDDLDTLLILLADIFARSTGFKYSDVSFRIPKAATLSSSRILSSRPSTTRPRPH